MADEDEKTGSVCQELYRARLARVLGISSIGAVPVHAGDAPSRQCLHASRDSGSELSSGAEASRAHA